MSAYTFGFIGTGNMGGALAKAARRTLSADQMLLTDAFTAKAEALAAELGCATGTTHEVASRCKYIFLGVKPQMMADLLTDIGPILAQRQDDFVLVSMAAGLARAGMKPYFAVYSTFLQRAYDQIVHDVCLQNLPVCIMSDHVSLVGDDGKTHHGVLSVPMLLSMPNMTLLAPRDTQSIRDAIRISMGIKGPCVIQYPKDGIEPYADDVCGRPLEAGKWQTLREGSDCAILAYGRMTKHAIEAAAMLEQEGISACVIDCWSLRPMDMKCLGALFEKKIKIVTIEEGELIGGFGSEIARLCVECGAEKPSAIIGLPNRFIAHGTIEQLLEEYGLMPEQIARRIKHALAQEKENG